VKYTFVDLSHCVRDAAIAQRTQTDPAGLTYLTLQAASSIDYKLDRVLSNTSCIKRIEDSSVSAAF
jgi:hypothetical protein